MNAFDLALSYIGALINKIILTLPGKYTKTQDVIKHIDQPSMTRKFIDLLACAKNKLHDAANSTAIHQPISTKANITTISPTQPQSYTGLYLCLAFCIVIFGPFISGAICAFQESRQHAEEKTVHSKTVTSQGIHKGNKSMTTSVATVGRKVAVPFKWIADKIEQACDYLERDSVKTGNKVMENSEQEVVVESVTSNQEATTEMEPPRENKSESEPESENWVRIA